MSNIGLLEKMISFFIHKALLSVFSLLTLVGLSQNISLEQKQAIASPAYEIKFENFSPAFAVLEDEFLFRDGKPQHQLISGKSNESYQQLVKENSPQQQPKIKINKVEKSDVNIGFDGFIAYKDLKKRSFPPAQQPSKKSFKNKHLITAQELAFGPLVTLVDRSQPKPGRAITHNPVARKSPKTTAPNKPKQEQEQEQEDSTKVMKAKKAPSSYKISGSLALKQGLAFLGSMEVSWVVDDYELQIGSINTPDATYEIQADKLIGDIIISLYDNNDELIGEGVLDLTQFRSGQASIQHDIDIFPIDWDHAGEVIHVKSLGIEKSDPVEGVSIQLYAFNEATQTGKDGTFSFYNWKKSNSRTLAIASKNGFKDSVFLMDSKRSSKVILFDDNSINSFFEHLQNIGIYSVADQGTVYGSITGLKDVSGYQVRLEKAKSIYFQTNLPTVDQDSTNANGLFAFVGLQDGDYELSIEKDGEIVDQKIVIVEQGKISPILVNLRNIKKHIQFYDPLQPDHDFAHVNLSFFDGIEGHDLSVNNTTQTQLKGGNEPSLMDYATENEATRTFVSRSKGLQRIPLLSDDRLMKVVQDNNMSVANGLIIGFVDSPTNYTIEMLESQPDTIIYFNENGDVINPQEVKAYGFIISGFPQGLSSLVVIANDDDLVLVTDLIFSNHQSISIINSQITGL